MLCKYSGSDSEPLSEIEKVEDYVEDKGENEGKDKSKDDTQDQQLVLSAYFLGVPIFTTKAATMHVAAPQNLKVALESLMQTVLLKEEA